MIQESSDKTSKSPDGGTNSATESKKLQLRTNKYKKSESDIFRSLVVHGNQQLQMTPNRKGYSNKNVGKFNFSRKISSKNQLDSV